MKVLKLIIKNSGRHKLRSFLTIVGIAVAVLAFCILRTVVTAWYSGIEASAANRLVTRQSVSFIFPLPYAYRDKIAALDGVETVTFFNWFQGVYKDKDNFFARLAIDEETMFDVYPEFLLSPEQKDAFMKDQRGCVIGKAIAKQYGLKVGDVMNIDGDIFPGQWDFIVRGIYEPRDKSTDATQMFFHWKYLNERMEKESPARANEIGWYVIKIKDPARSAELSKKIDNLFANSTAETKTETERAFQQGFIQASGAIITAMNFLAFVIIGIIMLVLGNTMIMTARERTREYAVLRTLGFSNFHVMGLIFGESLIISFLGGALGLFLSLPLIKGIEENMPKGFFPIFTLENSTIILALSSALLIGVLASVFPVQRALKTKIVDGLRFIG
jgi:putative ABC transport system permease protein